MLDVYVLPIEIQRQAVERIFAENGFVRHLFEELIASQEFDTFLGKILTEVQTEAELQQIEFTEEIQASVKTRVVDTAKIGLYRQAIQAIASEGEGDLATKICQVSTIKTVKALLRPLRFKKQIRQMLSICT